MENRTELEFLIYRSIQDQYVQVEDRTMVITEERV